MEGGGDKLPPSPFRKSVPPFPVKLRRLADDPNIRSVRWSPLGVTLLIHQKLLEEELLDSDTGAFKTRMFGSFYRQLNLYGFRRARVNTVGHPEHSDLEATELREFYHMYFQRDHPELLSLVRRPSCSRAALTERRAERIRLMQGPELLTDSCSQQHGKSAHPDRENTQEESTAFIAISDLTENDREGKTTRTHQEEDHWSGPVVTKYASAVSVVPVPMSPPTNGAQPSMESPKERRSKSSSDLPKNGTRSKTTETPRKADRRSSPVIPNVASQAMVVPVPVSPPTISTLQEGPIHDTFGLSLSGYESLWTSDVMVGDHTTSATKRRPLLSSPPRSLIIRPQEFSLRPRVPGPRRNFFGAAVNHQIPGTVGAAVNHQIPGIFGAAVNHQIPGTVGAAADHQIPGIFGVAAVNHQIPGTVGAAADHQIPGTAKTGRFQSSILTRLEERQAKPPQGEGLQMGVSRIETPRVELPTAWKVPQMGVPYIDEFQARVPQQEVLEVEVPLAEVPQIHPLQARVQEVDLSRVEAQRNKKLRTKVPLFPVTQVPQLTVTPVPTIETPQSTVPLALVTQVPQSIVPPVPDTQVPQSPIDVIVEEEDAAGVEICARCRRRSGPISEQTEETEAETANSHVKGANNTAMNEPETESLPEVFIPPPARNGPSLSEVSFPPQPSNELPLTPEQDPFTEVLQVPILNDPEKPTDSSCSVSMEAGSADPVVMVPDYVAMPTGCPDDVPYLHVANFEEVVTSPCKRQKARDERKGLTEQTSYRCAESEPTIPGEREFLRHLYLQENGDQTFYSEDVSERPKGKGKRCKKAGKRTRKPSKKKEKEMTHEEEVLAAVRSIEEDVNDETIVLNLGEAPTLQEPQYHEPRTGQEKHGPDVSEVLLPAASVPLVSYTDLATEDARKLPFKKRFHTAAAVQGRPVVQELQGQGAPSCVDDLIILGTSITLVQPAEGAANVGTDENPQRPTAEDEDNTLEVDRASSPTVVEGQIYVPPNQEVTFSEVMCENLEDFDFTVEIVGVDCEITEEQCHQDGQSEAAVRSQTFQVMQEEGHFPQATNLDTQPAVPLISASCEDFVNV